jgi:dCTP deaminase
VILSDRDIAWYMEKGLLRIDSAAPETIRENGVDLRLGDEFCRFNPNAPELDTRGSFDRETYYKCHRVGPEGFRVNPHEHVLATTLETVCLPDDLVGLVNVRSTFARLGLYIPPTVIDAGFCGQVTIEIIGSAYPVRLYPGQRFLHVVLVKTTSPVARPYRGKYQGQRGVTPPRLDPGPAHQVHPGGNGATRKEPEKPRPLA